MQVVLNKDVKGLGKRGELIKVKNGYFMNFLLPRGIASVATPHLMKIVEVRRAALETERKRMIEKSEEIVNEISEQSISIKVKASGKGKLYAALSEEDVVKLLKEEKSLEIGADFIKMPAVKKVGEHEVFIEFSPEMKCSFTLVVETE